MIVKKSQSPSQKLKELMKAIKELGGSEEQQLKAKQILKNYFKQAEKDE